MLSDYVYNVKGGGFIAMEDVDAMTNVLNQRTNGDETNYVYNDQDSFNLSTMLNWLDGPLTPSNLACGFSTNHIEKLDKAFLRKGRIDVQIEFTKCDHYQINTIYRTMKDKDMDIDVLTKIQEYKYTPADIISHLFANQYENIDDYTLMKELILDDNISVNNQIIY